MKQVHKEFILRCECGDRTDHVVMIGQYDLGEKYGDDSLGQCLISLTLDTRKFWYQRLWAGVKYIFGKRDYMYMDATIDVDKLREVVAQLEDTRTPEQKEAARNSYHTADTKVL